MLILGLILFYGVLPGGVECKWPLFAAVSSASGAKSSVLGIKWILLSVNYGEAS